ncbi:MAG: hypothetical protein WA950_02170 [Shinella sp.]|uniref:hypothetical protein n=1 Tax=Shinella sp. TaxID=1870904 RepID=UPI003C712FFB
MTKIDVQGGPKSPKPDRQKSGNDAKPDAEAETQEEKTRREQATNPALMPIGDPAGAA